MGKAFFAEGFLGLKASTVVAIADPPNQLSEAQHHPSLPNLGCGKRGNAQNIAAWELLEARKLRAPPQVALKWAAIPANEFSLEFV